MPTLSREKRTAMMPNRHVWLLRHVHHVTVQALSALSGSAPAAVLKDDLPGDRAAALASSASNSHSASRQITNTFT